ncbi:penicillin-binding protein [Beauveria bassiana ARSEF 2860]|uniref:Penicillin-binding protein n=1 Tax=Beauveria bassiana (strain ARSEF 2860) TaxID=655819 RepID=J4VPZ3_BEAB2|nr:penicillin-binding protein [Beauveria bassiana ARSEF 2860]EJP60755.1 penicillin-binding protein [Beauveria bassiana ARSEF 2860]
MAELHARLARLGPTIERLMSIGGTPGLALGVVCLDKPVYYANYGFRDVDKQLPVTQDTIFPVCSLAKAVTSAAMGLLVDGKKATWDSPIRDVLPAFQSTSPMLQENTTLGDILSHRTGMGWADNLILGTDGNVLLPGNDLIKFVNQQSLQCPFRAQFGYNNLHYELAGRVIEHLSGQSYADFVQDRLFKPLGMDRTVVSTPSADLNPITINYNALDDATPAPIKFLGMGDNGYGAPSGGLRSTVEDLAKFYGAFLQGIHSQFENGGSSSGTSILKQLPQITSAKIAIDQPSKHESAYAFGWARVQLPGRMGQIGLNPGLLPDGMPLVGKGTSQLVIYHQGSLPGSLALAALLPDLDSAVIVLTNSLALNDVADWVGQLVIEELINVTSDLKNDFISLAEKAVAKNLEWYPSVVEDLKKGQKSGTQPKP